MQHGDHSKDGTFDAAPGTAPRHADAPTEAAGWLDRLVLRGQPSVQQEGFRPRLPYPFEAMKFADGDPVTHPAARADDAAPPSFETPQPGAPSALTLAPHGPADAAPASVQAAPQAPPMSSARPALPAQAAERRGAEIDRPAVQPAHPLPHPDPQPPTANVRPVPATPRRGKEATIQPPFSPAPPASSARDMATPRLTATPGLAAGRVVPHQANPGRAVHAAGAQEASPLRGAARGPKPLPAKANTNTKAQAETGADITIDIHIGRIDVRAPSGPTLAPAPVAPASPRAGDALHSYLQRRGRGARS